MVYGVARRENIGAKRSAVNFNLEAFAGQVSVIGSLCRFFNRHCRFSTHFITVWSFRFKWIILHPTHCRRWARFIARVITIKPHWAPCWHNTRCCQCKALHLHPIACFADLKHGTEYILYGRYKRSTWIKILEWKYQLYEFCCTLWLKLQYQWFLANNISKLRSWKNNWERYPSAMKSFNRSTQ